MKSSALAAELQHAPDAAPLKDGEFAALLQPLGPFEIAPVIAVAVSGGADSLAATLLTARWAIAQGGRVIGVTVDHGLRPNSADEAEQVGIWLHDWGIEHKILRWTPPQGITNLQASAREARYRLLGDWCREQGILHLMTAHHLDDQAETFLLRLARGSGLFGLAAMPSIEEFPHFRLLRPLLDIPAERLKATLRHSGHPWIDDPSNHNQRFARVRVRSFDGLSALGLDNARLAATATDLGRSRAAQELVVDDLLARAAILDPTGVIWLKPEIFRRSPTEIRHRALAAILATASGQNYPPRYDSLTRLDHKICADTLGTGSTLAGCRIVPEREYLLVYRELRAMAPPMALPRQGEIIWDGRYIVTTKPVEQPENTNIFIAALQQTGIAQLDPIVGRHFASHLPKRAKATLPGFWQDGRLISAPDLARAGSSTVEGIDIRFRPVRSLTSGGFVGH